MVVLGYANSRMRDFFDVHALASARTFDGAALAEAIAATFARRATEVPRELPDALTHRFAEFPGKTAQWNGFTRRLGSRVLPNLADVVDVIANFGGPVLLAVGRRRAFAQKWSAGGPWRPGSDA